MISDREISFHCRVNFYFSLYLLLHFFLKISTGIYIKRNHDCSLQKAPQIDNYPLRPVLPFYYDLITFLYLELVKQWRKSLCIIIYFCKAPEYYSVFSPVVEIFIFRFDIFINIGKQAWTYRYIIRSLKYNI